MAQVLRLFHGGLGAVVAATLLAVACSTGSTSTGAPDGAAAIGPRETGGGLWEHLAEARRDKERRLAADRGRRDRLEAELERGRAQVPAETRAKMETWWRQFLQDDPAWAESRILWRAEGEAARDILVENLIIVVARAYEANQGRLYKRARGELFELEGPAVPYLVAALEGQHGDDVLRTRCIEILSDIGRPALAAIGAAYEGSPGPEARLDLMRAVSAMGEHGAPESVALLREGAREDGDFRVRLAAVEGLGRVREDAAVRPLLECLEDDDLSVRKFAAAALANYRSDAVIEGLVRALLRAERAATARAREAEVAVNCRRALQRITGLRHRNGKEWETWWLTRRR